MGRRTSGQQVGLQSIGNVQANANTLTTTQSNQNLTISPNGTGIVNFQSSTTFNSDVNVANQGDLRLLESSGNGTNYIAQQAAANMAANYTITWPAAVSPTSGFVLSSDTSGTLSWASAGGNIPVSDPGSSATVHYPFFGTSAGALPTSLSPLARTNLSFVPSTGILTSSGVAVSASTTSTNASSGALIVTGGVGVGGALNVTGAITTNSQTVVTTTTRPALGTNGIIRTNVTTINESITIPAGTNGFSSGPITIAAGQTVTVNGDWSIV
jgi:hypothetical protein